MSVHVFLNYLAVWCDIITLNIWGIFSSMLLLFSEIYTHRPLLF